MGQSPAAILFAIFSLLLGTLGCDSGPRKTSTTQKTFSRPTVASLVPAATDLIVGMHADDHLVAISNWDPNRPETAGLPRVGDYRNVDWEKLASLKPHVIIVQFAQGKMPPGLHERAQELQASLVNVHNNQLADLFQTITQLGNALHEPQKAREEATAIQAKLDHVKSEAQSKSPVKVFLARDATELASVGGGNFLDELLTIAGGKNVIQGGQNSYPTIDREKLADLNPDVVIVLLPSASNQVVAEAKRFWSTLTEINAVKNQQIYIWTDDWLLLPASHVGDLADKFLEVLHPTATTAPATSHISPIAGAST